MEKIDTKAAEQFYSAVLKLRTMDECRSFFDDVCTIKELQDLVQRFQVALLLDEGKNYMEISRQTSVSSATISRVNRCLVYGDGGYRTVIKRMKDGGSDD
ncbi:MAG: helix-turn-helix domain-containing protein [Spirochaetales bacterium]|nr:helix-turn-helix domain-containing protein [Spirochaetales bacterium]MCR5442252.1 TrpR YerC/YecD [Sphaerochaetaceae bacterium]MBQ3698091.1 helix-turn-helix domain-containing protein [Spirochaetales bacterium]MBQ3729445.1 helix-turn-helix domain-containing protein [Spirochaetales bacterium]MBQ3830807.1 helix-turn-helix domain-containing protein [Spirochaetales bacterium]